MTDEMNHYKTEEKDVSQRQTKYITWPEEDENDDQSPILQPVSGNGGRTLKGGVERRHGAKERSIKLTALKFFARQGIEYVEKPQLEEWKAELFHNLTSEVAQIHNSHNDATWVVGL